MTTLIFKNQRLKEILKISEQATVFKATYEEAVKAYESDAGQKYQEGQNLAPYFLSNVPTLWLVKDTGIYLMTSAKLESYPDDESHLCYAEGFEPDAPESYEKCKGAVGGDDFSESFKFTDALKRGIKLGADIHISINPTEYTIQLSFPSNKENKS